jgi:hypothetical protein
VREVTVYFRDHGNARGAWSLRGNGALILYELGLVLLITGTAVLAARRAWVATAVWPVAFFVGVFLLLGPA